MKCTSESQSENKVENVIRKVREQALEYSANPDMVEILYRNMLSGFINLETNKRKKYA